MLWYLHLCSEVGIMVTEYSDYATGIMLEKQNGSGRFTKVTLYPVVKVLQENMLVKAKELHKKANKLCFIANSSNFSVLHQPITKVL